MPKLNPERLLTIEQIIARLGYLPPWGEDHRLPLLLAWQDAVTTQYWAARLGPVLELGLEEAGINMTEHECHNDDCSDALAAKAIHEALAVLREAVREAQVLVGWTESEASHAKAGP